MAKFVGYTAAKRLELGGQVIKDVRQMLPYGAGNQIADSQRTGGESSGRTVLAMQDAGKLQGQEGVIRNLLRMAGAAVTWGAGNCQEQAAVTYTVLRSKCDAKTKVSYCIHSGSHHVFAAIGEPLVDPAGEVVIVDPWPINAQALLWEDHFCYESKATANFVVWRTKFGGKAMRIDKHADHFGALARRKEVVPYVINASLPGSWNHQWGSKTKAWVDYTDDLLTDSLIPR